MDYNIALLPAPSVAARLVRLSERIGIAGGGSLTLGPSRLPHVTLYLASFRSRSIGELISRAMHISSRYEPCRMRVRWTITKSGLVMVGCEVSPKCVAFHRSLVRRLRDVRTVSPAQTWRDSRTSLNSHQRKLLNNVGYPFALGQCQPHFTVGRIEPQRAAKATRIVSRFDLTCTIEQVALGRVGVGGTFTEVVASWRLGSAE